MSEKLLPCAFCRNQPTQNEENFYCCINKECCGCLTVSYRYEAWNLAQVSLLAQRRKDFNAGVEWSFENMFRSDTHDSQYFDKYLEKERGK